LNRYNTEARLKKKRKKKKKKKKKKTHSVLRGLSFPSSVLI